MSDTKIEWADAVWNPVTGCTPVSAGCQHCYAARMAKRLAGRCGYPADEPFAVTSHFDRLSDPLAWRKPKRVFVCSMGDLFHADVTEAIRQKVFGVMSLAGQHTFMVLTKRPERMAEWFAKHNLSECQAELVAKGRYDDKTPTGRSRLRDLRAINGTHKGLGDGNYWPLPNVWLGTSVEDQATADERIPHLLRCPAAVRFVSAEPLLGPIDLADAVVKRQLGDPQPNWVIAGGETGPGARPAHPDWVRALRDQCQAASVPFFFKQWGEYGAGAVNLSTGEPTVRMFRDHGHWVAKASTWVNGGVCVDGRGQVCRRGEDFTEATFPVAVMHRVGKSAAGHLLDGREWREFPR
jgi:protein gp37